MTAVAAGGDLNGDGFADVLAGDPNFDQGRGRVLVFLGSSSGLGTEANIVWRGRNEERGFGRVLQLLGDVDGDGFDDVLVTSMPASATTETAAVYRGSTNLAAALPQWALPATSVGIGDVNGDGYEDIAWRAIDANGESMVQVAHGSPHGFSAQPVWSAQCEQRGAHLGHQLTCAGDVNGDGYDDLVVSAMRFSGRLRSSGKVYLYLGSSQGLGPNATWSAEYPLPTRVAVDEAYEQFFGWGLAGAGDVNHDGFDDLMVGACFADHGDLNEGLAFVYHGSRHGLNQTPDWWAESNQAHSLFASTVRSPGDVNGDGFDDVLVSLPMLSNEQMLEGGAALYAGSKNGLAPQPAWLMESGHTSENFGELLSSAGDINGDGYADVLIGSVNYRHVLDMEQVKCGRLVVAYGGPEGLRRESSLSLEKPVLTALQQEVARYQRRFGSAIYWAPWLVVLGLVSGGFIFVQARLRRRLAEEIEKNRLLILAQERKRLARDLHDELGGHLARLASEGNLASPLADVAREVTTGIERTIWSLHPEHRTISDLACGLTDLAENVLGGTSIRCRFDIPLDLPDAELPSETLGAIYRATQEALNNVRKHSRAHQTTVTLRWDPVRIEVSIADDGIGYTVEGAGRGGLGFANMAARLNEVGGTCAAQPNDPQGSVIRLTVPWKQ